MSEGKKTYYLCEELLMEIMKRLPVKYILRCRSVEKSWYNLLHSSYFIALHSRHQNSWNKYLLFHYHDRCGLERHFSLRFDDKQCKEYCELRFPQDVEGELVYETCNGLICLSATGMHEVYIWNPSLRVFRVLPDSPLRDPTTLGLAFVYLPKTNDYKIIKYESVFRNRRPKYYCVNVYSVSTDSWKTVKKPEVGGFSMKKLSDSVVVNGAAYWVASINVISKNGKAIVCFDMEKDTIREIRLPPPYSTENARSDVLVENTIFGELLSLFYYNRSTYVLHIWVLENAGDPNEIWMKKTPVNFEPSWRPLGFRNNGAIVLRSGAKKFLSYDLEKNEAKDIVDDDSLDAFKWYSGMYSYSQQRLNRLEDNLVLLDVNRQGKIHRVSQRK